jgi:hypothetical protein
MESKKNCIYAAAIQDHCKKRFNLSSQSLNKTRVLSREKRQLEKWTKNITKVVYSPEKNICKYSGEERVLDPPLNLSLAQKLGIVERPRDRLTEKEWEVVKSKCITRKEDKCLICCEVFTNQDQILLSCSHVYHLKCLQSWEKFTFKRNCPLCRQEYEKRTFYQGKKNYYNNAATKIQSVFRMYIKKKAFKEVQRNRVPSNPLLYKKYFAEKLSVINSNLQVCDISSFLAELDLSLENSRQILQKSHLEYSKLLDWDLISKKALKNYCTEDVCTICISPLYKRPKTLLNCSHIFHSACISTFEKFVDGTHTCPICRHVYTRIDYEII